VMSRKSRLRNRTEEKAALSG